MERRKAQGRGYEASGVKTQGRGYEASGIKAQGRGYEASGIKAQGNRTGGGGQNKRLGLAYEQKAAEYLEKKGFQILERNYYTRCGEIDLIVRDGAYLVFVEVKYRASQRGGHPLEAVDARKQRRLRRAAALYLLRCGYPENTPCRFDVVGILGEEIFHVENAFEG